MPLIEFSLVPKVIIKQNIKTSKVDFICEMFCLSSQGWSHAQKWYKK